MKFYINAGKFTEGLKPAHCLAVRKMDKNWYWAEKISIDSSKDGIAALAYQKDTFVVTNISEDNYYGLGYLSLQKGFTTVNTFDLMDALNSFSPLDSIIIEYFGNELKLINASDKEEFQTVSTFDSHIGDPEIAPEFLNELVIDREIFTKGISKVAFTMGNSENQSYYMCVMFKVSANGVRFAAGSGARFAIYDIEGIQLTTDPLTIYFPRYTIPVLRSILSKANADEILIKQTKIATGSINQAVIEFGGTQIVIFNLDPSINYPSLNSIMDHTYSYNASVKVSDLKPAVSGVLATFTKELKKEYDVHAITVTADFIRGFLTLKAESDTSASRKVYLSGKSLVTGKSEDRDCYPYFKCNSDYLKEVIKKVNKGEDITLSFEDTRPVKVGKSPRPVLVEFPPSVSKSNNITEKFCIFFATAKKEEG